LPAIRDEGAERYSLPDEKRLLVAAGNRRTRGPSTVLCSYAGLVPRVRHVARVALARRLLIAVYVLLHDGVMFDEDKFAAV